MNKHAIAVIAAIGVVFFYLTVQPAFAKTVKVAIVPPDIVAPSDMGYLKGAAMDMLSSRIGSGRGVELVRGDLVKKELAVFIATDEALEALGQRLGADYVLSSRLTIFEGYLTLDARLLDTASRNIAILSGQGQGQGSFLMVAEVMAKEALALIKADVADKEANLTYVGKFRDNTAPESSEEKTYPVISKKSERERPVLWKGKPLNTFYMDMGIADLDSDGTKEIILMSEKTLLIAAVDGDALRSIKEIKNPPGFENISLDVFDADYDGRQEVYLSRLNNGVPDSAVIEYIDDAYTITASNIKRIMNVINVEGSASLLVSQGFRNDTGYFEGVKTLKREAGELKETGALALPEDVEKRGMYGVSLVDLTGDAQNEVVSLDRRGYLHIYENTAQGWKEIIKTTEFYGGSLTFIAMAGNFSSGSSTTYFTVEADPVFADIDSNGKMELLLRRNDPGIIGRFAEHIKSFKSSAVLDFSLEGSILEENWTTKEFTGYVADFTIDDLNGDGLQELVVLVVEDVGKYLQKDVEKSYLITFKLQ
ncbi:MAG: VCBS repeat-containing protein [Deltaproteobacteria bacterium]|nr:VCBS repeat-containing protein [Deltaproteobacteria bacterium]